MIEVKADKGAIELEMIGSMDTISADLCVIIKGVYDAIFDKDPISAIMLRQFITSVVSDEQSPVFKYDYKKEDNNE